MQRIALALALEADVDPRTAARALREGADAIRGRAGERTKAAMTRLGLARPDSTPPPHP